MKVLIFFLAEEVEFIKATAPEAISIESSYKGPHIELPINKMHFESLILAFQRGEVKASLIEIFNIYFISLKILHARYILLILHEVRRILKRLPNINIVSTHQSKCVTVVGDLHGSLSDLMLIFHKVIFDVFCFVFIESNYIH